MSTKTGHQIIEEALAKAALLDGGNSPFGMDPEIGVIYQKGLAAAYQHALEMIPDDSKEVGRLKVLAEAFRKLQNCMGYVHNGSQQSVRLSQDDATNNYHMACGDDKPRAYWGTSLVEVINQAHAAEGQE